MSKEVSIVLAVAIAVLFIALIYTNLNIYSSSGTMCIGKMCEIHLTGAAFKIEMDCADYGYEIVATVNDTSVVDIISNGTKQSDMELFGVAPKCYYELRGRKIGMSDVVFSYCNATDCSNPIKKEIFHVMTQ